MNNILRAGLLAGTLDFLAAVFILSKGNALGVLKVIASGVYGKAAFSGHPAIIAAGILLHFCIAVAFAAAYFWAYPQWAFLRKNKWASGVFYGVFVWVVMNMVVLPLSLAPPMPLHPEAVIKNVLILIACVGLPIAWLADRHFASSNLQHRDQ
jgi:hypothetical protein